MKPALARARVLVQASLQPSRPMTGVIIIVVATWFLMRYPLRRFLVRVNDSGINFFHSMSKHSTLCSYAQALALLYMYCLLTHLQLKHVSHRQGASLSKKMDGHSAQTQTQTSCRLPRLVGQQYGLDLYRFSMEH